MEPVSERKLAAILAADVSGYSRLMESDEAGTLATLKARRETIAEAVSAYRGRVVGTAGDSVLAEFASVVNAVECAVRIQRQMAERDATLPEERRMRFRIGINVGDVLVEGDDLFGEGVNIAARLQALAEPGGILISGTVFDQVRNKLSIGFDYLGPQAVKNISESVPAWRVVLDGPVLAPPAAGRLPHRAETDRPGQLTKRERLQRRTIYAALLIVLMLTINALTWHGEFWAKWPILGIVSLWALRSMKGWWR